jgi:hypothetical protein
MNNKTTKMAVPDIGNLLGRIAEKRDELPKAVIQRVQPIEEAKSENSKELKGENVKELKSLSGKTLDNKRVEVPNKTGRKTLKDPAVEYVKISPKISKVLKKQVDRALVDERLKDGEGRPLTTLDECVAFALDRLITIK